MAEGESNPRFLPFNLSTVVPFEATAAALRALPCVQPRAPVAPSFLPDDEQVDEVPLDEEVASEMHEMLAEVAREGGWVFTEEDVNACRSFEVSSGTGAWVSQLARALPDMLPSGESERRHVSTPDTRPAKRPRTSKPPVERTTAPPRSEHPEEEDDERETQRDAVVREAFGHAKEDAVKRFVSVLEGFVDRADLLSDRNGGDVHEARLSVTSSRRYMNELLQNIEVHAQQELVSLVPEVVLRNVIEILGVRVRAAAASTGVLSQLPIPVGDLHQAELGLRSACMVLTLLTAPNTPRSLFLQDALDDSLLMLRVACTHVMYPSCDPMAALPESFGKVPGRKSGVNGTGEEDESEDAEKAGGSGSGRRCNVPKLVSDLLHLSAVLCEKFADLFQRERGLAESFVSQMVSLSIRSLHVEGTLPFQVSASRLVEAIVASYPEQSNSVADLLLECLCKLPANRRSLRGYRVFGGSQQVRVGSALLIRILNVVGGCADEDSLGSASLTPGDAPDALRRRCSVVALRFVDEFLKRTFRERDVELKTALQVLFVDLLALYGLPEYPSAELVIQAFGVRLGISLNKGGELPVQARVICLDMLGALAARISRLYGVAHLLGSSSENVWSNQEIRAGAMSHRVSVLSYLKEQGKSDTSCGYAQLFLCTQFVVDDAEACEEGHKALRVRDPGMGESDISSAECSRLRREAMRESSRALTDAFRSMRGVCEGDRAIAAASSVYLSQRRPLARGLPRIVDTIREGLLQPEPTLRAKAIKTLAVVAEADPGVLKCVPSLLGAVEQSCGDVSKSVREASLDLLSRCFAASAEAETEFFERVFPVVKQRLVDAATSVRKRAITIIHQVVLEMVGQIREQVPSGGSSVSAGADARVALERAIVRICCTLADRLEDREETVRLAAERVLRLVMFDFDPAQVQAPPSRTEDETTASGLASRLTAIYSHILSNPRATASQRNVISLVLHDAIIVKRRSLLASIVADVVDMLHSTEARLAEVARLGNGSTSSQTADLLLAKRVACTAVLEALAKVEPELLSSHCVDLTPYLKGNVPIKPRIAFLHIPRILNILEMCIPKAGRPFEASRLEEVIRDVEKMVCICPVPAIAPSAIRCFSALARHSTVEELRSLPEETAHIFYSFLLSAKGELADAKPSSSSEAIRNARQALPRLGLLARHADLGADFLQEIFELLSFICGRLTNEWMTESKSSEYSQSAIPGHARKKVVFGLRQSAILSLTHFIVRHRKYLPKAVEILIACLRQGGPSLPDFEAQITVLSGVQELLREEESRNLAAAVKIGAERKQAQGSAQNDVILAAEEDAEAGFLALCAQAIVPELKVVSGSEDVEVRKTVVSVLAPLARQGLVHPASIVPSLFGLLADGNSLCRESALGVVGFLADRHPSMLASGAMSGVRCSYLHAMRTNSVSAGSDKVVENILRCAVDCKSGYALLSPGLLHINRQQRRSILCNITREFDPKAKVSIIATAARSTTGVEVEVSEDEQTFIGGLVDSSIGAVEQHCRSKDGIGVIGTGSCDRNESSVAGAMEYDDDEDVGTLKASRGVAKLRASGTNASASTLAFYAATLATMDYAGGAGVGGSFTVGGGTSVADTKLKCAREDVLEVTGVASRIISNSGQAILQASKRIVKGLGGSTEEKAEVARQAIPVCMLLLVKKFLRQVRWNIEDHEHDKVDNDSGDGGLPVPQFAMSKLTLKGPVYGGHPCAELSSEEQDTVLEYFRELMREDSIDEAEEATGASVRKRKVAGRGGPGRSVSKRKAKPGVQRKRGGNAHSGRIATRRTAGNGNALEVEDAD